MVRAFRRDPVDRAVLERLVATASRAPSAGKTQGWSLVVLEQEVTETFWTATMSAETRAKFRWQHLFDAPMIVLSLANPHAYLERYSEDDKSRTKLGESVDAWPVPYWTVDASFATMTLLLGAHDAGLGALFFGVFHGERQLRQVLSIPDHLQIIGAIALGHERTPTASEIHEAAFGDAASAGRTRAAPDDIIHYGRW